MSDGDEKNARMETELRRFGWLLGPEFEQRYATDAWVFNLANAVEAVAAERDAALARAEAAESALVTARAAIHELLDQREDRWNDYDETIRGLLAALFEPTTETCPECEGNSERSLGSGLFCKTCGEAGTVPGPPLAYLAADLKQVGWHNGVGTWGGPPTMANARTMNGKRIQLNPQPLKITETKPGALRCVRCKRNSRNCRCGVVAKFEIRQEDGTWK